MRLALLEVLAICAVAVMIGCGSDAPEEGASDNTNVIDEAAITSIGDRPEISAWTRPNREFTYEEFIEAGWKQHQIYDVENTPQRPRCSLRVPQSSRRGDFADTRHTMPR